MEFDEVNFYLTHKTTKEDEEKLKNKKKYL